MDGITYRYLIAFSIEYKLKMHLMDVVTAYLYGVLDTEIYMKAPQSLSNERPSIFRGEPKGNAARSIIWTPANFPSYTS